MGSATIHKERQRMQMCLFLRKMILNTFLIAKWYLTYAISSLSNLHKNLVNKEMPHYQEVVVTLNYLDIDQSYKGSVVFDRANGVGVKMDADNLGYIRDVQFRELVSKQDNELIKTNVYSVIKLTKTGNIFVPKVWCLSFIVGPIKNNVNSPIIFDNIVTNYVIQFRYFLIGINFTDYLLYSPLSMFPPTFLIIIMA